MKRILALLLLLVGFLLGWANSVSEVAFAASGDACINIAQAGGTSDALTVNSLPCTPTSSLLVLTTPLANLGSNPTLSINAGPAKVIKGPAGGTLAAGSLQANGHALLTFNGTNWFLLNSNFTFTLGSTPIVGGTATTTVAGLTLTSPTLSSPAISSPTISGQPRGPLVATVATNANLKALNVAGLAAGQVVFRGGFSSVGDGGRAEYYWSTSACSLNAGAGDDGSQVQPTVGSGCWLLFPQLALDARVWGQTYPLVLTVATAPNGGSDGGGLNTCVVPAKPCLTTQHAHDMFAKFDLQGQNGTINVGAGTFAGATFSGASRGAAGNQISGQYEVVAGVPGSTFITTDTGIGGGIYNLNVTSGAKVVFKDIEVSVASGVTGIFAQYPGTYVNLKGVTVTGAAGANTGIHGEQFAQYELDATTTLKMQGTFTTAIAHGPNASMVFDPGGAGVFSCGTGLATSATFFLSDNSTVYFPSGWTTSGCAGATGVPLFAYNNAVFNNGSGVNIPGSGTFTLKGNARYFPDPLPGLGVCANGAVDADSTNNSIRVRFTGANAACAVVFGKPSNVTSWFTATPRCSVTSGAAAAKGVSTNAIGNLGLNVVSVGFVAGDYMDVLCEPGSNG